MTDKMIKDTNEVLKKWFGRTEGEVVYATEILAKEMDFYDWGNLKAIWLLNYTKQYLNEKRAAGIKDISHYGYMITEEA